LEYRPLGRSGLNVSRLCFGTLTIGPLQANLSVSEGSRLLEIALAKGVNFIDTAELYGTYAHIRQALRHCRDKPVVASKSYAYTRQGMRESLEKALADTGLPCIDIFLLHEQESDLTLAGHRAAYEYLLEAKEEGLIRAIGISTHTVACLRAAVDLPALDVVHPLINLKGIGIPDGTSADVLAALAVLRQKGVGVYGMKPLGGGHLIAQTRSALEYVRGLEQLDAVAVGMACPEEIEYNCALFAGLPPEEKSKILPGRQRRLFVDPWCRGCGGCVARCPQQALSLQKGQAASDEKICLLCGYCGAHCPDFCLKIF